MDQHMMTRSVFATVASLVLLAGPGVPAASAQPAAEGAPPASLVGTAGGITEVLQLIAARSPDVLAAQAVQSQAEAHFAQSRAAFLGKVDAYGLSQHFNDPRLTRPITQPPVVALYPFAANQFGYGIEYQLPIDLSRRIAAEVDAARSTAEGARWSADDMRLRAVLDGAALYRNLQALSGQSTALARQLDALQASERAAAAGLKAGTVARVSLLRVQAAVAEVQASIAGVRGQERAQRAQLAGLMGVDSFPVRVESLESGPVAVPADPSAEPPGLRAVQSTVLAAQANVDATRRAQYPQFFVNGGWNHNAIQWDTQGIDTWQVNVGVRVNVWSGGAQRRALDAAQGADREARQHLQRAQDNLRAAREGATARWEAQEGTYHAALSGLQVAEESERIEQDRFRTGLGSATELIDAAAALARARASVANALAGWWQADDALRYAYGEPPLALQEPTPTSSIAESAKP
jgi:outer membrane protein TolC